MQAKGPSMDSSGDFKREHPAESASAPASASPGASEDAKKERDQ